MKKCLNCGADGKSSICQKCETQVTEEQEIEKFKLQKKAYNTLFLYK